MKLIDGTKVFSHSEELGTNEFDEDISLELVAACTEYAKQRDYVTNVISIENGAPQKSVIDGQLYSYPNISIGMKKGTGLIMAQAKIVNGKWSIVDEHDWPAD